MSNRPLLVLTGALCGLMMFAPIAIAIRAQHGSPTIEDKHAAEADDSVAIDAGLANVAMGELMSHNAPVWERTPGTLVPLFQQNLVSPFGGGTINGINVKSLRNEAGIAFRLEWQDATRDDGHGDSKYKDGVAIEFPVDKSGDTRLAMGHSGGPVNILYWTADTTKRKGPQAEELVAAGIYERARKDPKYQLLRSASARVARRWCVVIFKPNNEADIASPHFTAGAEIPVAFAVWNGSAGDRLGSKSVSNWNLLRCR
jgi:DMSO reductase family type II enzyme heme b subunit